MKKKEEVTLLDHVKEAVISYIQNYWTKESQRDPVHGLPHFERVYGYLRDTGYDLDSDITTPLIIAVGFHDIGGHLPGDHAENSGNIFVHNNELETVRQRLTDKQRRAVEMAIRYHSRGLMGLTDEEKSGLSKFDCDLLVLTVVLDHLDALGHAGHLRTCLWALPKKLPMLPDARGIEIIKKILRSEIADLQPYRYLKNESVTGHLAYNLGATPQIIQPVEYCLGLSLSALLIRKQKETRILIEHLLS